MSTPSLSRVPSSTDRALSRFVSGISFLPPDDVMSSGWLEHGAFAFWLVEALKPRKYVELGTDTGFSYFAVCQAIKKLDLPTTCHAIDTWTGDGHAGFDDDGVFNAVVELNEKYRGFSTLMRSSSADAVQYFADGSIDLLHFDGRDVYEDVKTDFATWRPKLANNAIVLFHDTNVREKDFDVWRFFEELKRRHATFEFKHGRGLGMLAVSDVPDSLRALFECGEEEAAATRAIYTQLGANARHIWTIKEQQTALRNNAIETNIDQAGIENRKNAVIKNCDLQLEAMRKEIGDEINSHQMTKDLLDASNNHLARINASFWTKFGFAVDAIVLGLLRIFGIGRREGDPKPPPSESKDDVRCEDTSLERDPISSMEVDHSPLDCNTFAEIDNTKKEIIAKSSKALDEFLLSDEKIDYSCSIPSISVIIVLWNKAPLTLQCLRALKSNGIDNTEVVLIDNGSNDQTSELASRLHGIKYLRNETNLGFVAACNQGCELSTAPYLLLLNNDAFVRSGAILSALQTLRSGPNVGVVGGLLVLPDGTAQEAGSIVWADGSCLGYGRGWDPQRSELMFRREVDYCSGAFLLTHRKLWMRLGGFKEAFSPAYYEDVDYCMRVRALGLKVIYEPAAVVDHFEFGSTSGSALAVDLMQKNRKIFRTLHSDVLMRSHLPGSRDNVLYARTDRSGAKRRLLHIDALLPLQSQGAGFPRAFEMIAAAAALGWDITLYPLLQTAVHWAYARLKISPDVEIICDKARPSLRDFIADRVGYYDTVIISRPDIMQECLPMLAEGLLAGTRIVYDAEALFAAREISRAEVEGRRIPAPEANRLIEKELALAKQADVISCASGAEAALFRKALAKPVFVVSHTSKAVIDVAPFEQRSGFLFVGRLFEQESPNWMGLAWFIKECWPLIRSRMPHAALTVVGKVRTPHQELDAPGVEVVGQVDRLEPFYQQARVFVAPIRFAAGIPLKIIEAAFASVPCVGTCLMAQLLGWTSGIEMVASDDPSALAASAAQLHEDGAVWTAVRDAATARAAAEFDPDVFRQAMEDLLG